MSFTLRTDEEFDRALEALSRRSGESRQKCIRRLVLEDYHRDVHEQVVGEAIEALRRDSSRLLERLVVA